MFIHFDMWCYMAEILPIQCKTLFNQSINQSKNQFNIEFSIMHINDRPIIKVALGVCLR